MRTASCIFSISRCSRLDDLTIYCYYEVKLSERGDELVMLPLSFIQDLILRIAVDTNSMSFSFKKLPLILLLILINHLAIAHLILLKLALKLPSLVKLVMPYHLLIIPPSSIELVPIRV